MHQGEFIMIDAARPYVFKFHDFCSTIIVELPKSVIESYLPEPERLNFIPMRGGPALNRMVGAMMDCLFQRVVSEGQDSDNTALGNSLMEVIASAYGSSEQVKPTGRTAAACRRIQIKRYIKTHLANSDLAPSTIAKNNNVSSRYLRFLFAEEGVTVSRYVLRLRLEECARRLRDPVWQGTNITEIALSWGFNDIAHFNRSFREYFGMSPREYRRRE